MTAAQASTAPTLPRMAWVPVAAVLLGAGWGSNQITPMLLVYGETLGLGTGTLEAMFGVYALGLIPGLLLAGPLSDAADGGGWSFWRPDCLWQPACCSSSVARAWRCCSPGGSWPGSVAVRRSQRVLPGCARSRFPHWAVRPRTVRRGGP